VLTMVMDVSLDMALLETVDMLALEDMDIMDMHMQVMELSEVSMESVKLTLMPSQMLMLTLSVRSIMDSQFTMPMLQDIPIMLEL